MMKLGRLSTIALFCALILPFQASASMTGTFRYWKAKYTGEITPPVVKSVFSPEAPKQGEAVSAFLDVSPFVSPYPVRTFVVGLLDGQPTELLQPSENIFVARLGSFDRIATHVLTAQIYIEDLKESDETRNSISILNAAILDLSQQLSHETDPDRRAALQAQLTDKTNQRSELSQALLDLRRLVGENTFNFSVSENATSPDYPHIAAISPVYGAQEAATAVALTGSNLAANTRVFLGGTEITPVTFTNSGSIGFAVPAGTPTGLKDLELRIGAKNAILKNAFLVVAGRAPSAIAYEINPAIYTKETAISPNAPVASGGIVASYSISPSLPNGLSLDPQSGEITGTPHAVSAITDYLITATNSFGSAHETIHIAVNDIAPGALSYSHLSATYTKGTTIEANSPSSGGGTVTSYSVYPNLPAGISLDTHSGLITGNPSEISSARTYRVTALNSGGQTSVELVIAVQDAAPASVSYALASATYVKGAEITPNAPTLNSGGVPTSYAINPALPAGLSLDHSTGVIRGLPTEVSASQQYTVTASNSAGSAPAYITIEVRDVAALSVSSVAFNSVLINQTSLPIPATVQNIGPSSATITMIGLGSGSDFTISSGGSCEVGTVLSSMASCTINAVFHPTTLGAKAGLIQVLYANGANIQLAAATLSGQAVDLPPTSVGYGSPNFVFTKGSQITPMVPSTTGGAVTGFAITPSLPANLLFDTNTGIISGTPNSVMASQMYTVTASNSFGFAQAQVTITVNDIAPASLSYQVPSANYTVGQAILSNSPTVTGGAATNFSVNPALPSGLNLNPQTGVISGYPLIDSALTPFVVTASNSGGSKDVTIYITVSPIPVTGLAAVAASDKNTCVISDGSLYCWGDNEFGQLGIGSYSSAYRPVKVLTGSVTAVAVSRHHTCAVQGGALKCWGLNNKGQLGTNSTTSVNSPQSVVAPLNSDVLSVSVGPEYTCAIKKTDGSLYCFGNYLGLGGTQKTPFPILSSGAQMMSGGRYFMCGVVGGSDRCMGQNYLGSFGDGTTNTASYSFLPSMMGMSSGVSCSSVAVVSGCAIQNGALKCSGYNLHGELGDGTNTSSSVPSQVATQTEKVAFASSGGCTTNGHGGPSGEIRCVIDGGGDGDHTCSIVEGALSCFGDNQFGALGIGTNDPFKNTPTQVSGLTFGVKTAAVAARHGCAIDSALKCWGDNFWGQLGDGTTHSTNAPNLVSIVNPMASSLSYSASTVTYPVGTAIPAIIPNASGGQIAYYTISPGASAPPGWLITAGLHFDSGSGIITGIPTATNGTNGVTYTITGRGTNGESISTTLTIKIVSAMTAEQ